MKRFALPLSLLIVVLWAALQPADVLTFSAPFFPMRKALTSLTGALALGWMAFCMLLALRPAWLEHQLGGLDKLYRTHKWAGITAVVLVATHWLLILSPRTLIAWGWIEGVVRGHKGHGGKGAFALIGTAREMGEWAATIMIILGIVALLRFIPYGWFRKLHKGFPIAFLLGAFHSVMLLPNGAASTPFGMLVIALSLVGSVIALISLIGIIGQRQTYGGHVTSAVTTDSGVLDLHVRPNASWPGHKEGQFVLLTLDAKEGPHPFTIASDWKQGGTLRFAIKPLGDYTRTLSGRVKPGDTVEIEGPFGRFDFGDASEEQVWVAGGIGIAPFIARLETLAASGGAQGKVHFFYSVRSVGEACFPEGLQDLCRRAGVELHLRISTLDGHFKTTDIGKFVRQSCSVWFCGPSAWGKSLQSALQRNNGLPAGRFYRELFEFR